MQNFKSKDKAVTTDSMFNAFRNVMNNPEQRALVEKGHEALTVSPKYL